MLKNASFAFGEWKAYPDFYTVPFIHLHFYRHEKQYDRNPDCHRQTFRVGFCHWQYAGYGSEPDHPSDGGQRFRKSDIIPLKKNITFPTTRSYYECHLEDEQLDEQDVAPAGARPAEPCDANELSAPSRRDVLWFVARWAPCLFWAPPQA
jgi:hypothetical protein